MLFQKGEEKQNEPNEEGKSTVPAETALDNVAIREMPENFRYNRTTASGDKKSGLIILAGGLAFLLIFVALAYFLVIVPQQKKKNASTANNTPTIPVKPPETKATTTTETEEATKAYRKINDEFATLRDLTEYAQFIQKFGSAYRKKEWDDNAAKMNALPAEKKPGIFTALKTGIPTGDQVKNIDTSINDKQAALNIATVAGDLGSVYLVFEDNIWKLDREKWAASESAGNLAFVLTSQLATTTAATSTVTTTTDGVASSTPTGTPDQIVLKPGIDSDSDGLTDKEEAALGTDPTKADSDKDGYNDFAEFNQGYNPTGKGKLTDTKIFSRYTNKTYGYSAYHLTAWLAAQIDGDNIIAFKSPDGQFFQVLFQANPEKKTIEDWYKEIMGKQIIEPKNLIGGQGWRGVMSDDGLNVYLSSGNPDKIFVLTYNTGNGGTSDYGNLFKIFVKEFKFGR